MQNEIPVYLIQVSDSDAGELEVDFIALVDRPAIQKEFLAFRNEQPARMEFTVVSEDRRIVSGPAILADTPVIRVHPKTKEKYYTVFPRETVLKIAQKFMRKGYQQNVNIMHEGDLQPENVTIFESFVTDASRGILPMKGFEDAPEGSWFVSMFIENDATWSLVKEGRLRGFSVEGLFGLKYDGTAGPEDYKDVLLLRQIEEILNSPEE